MKKILLSICLTLSIFTFHFSFAQTPTWKNITPTGWSGTFQFVDWFAGNGLIAIADNGYFYKSIDTGKTWTPYPKPVASFNYITLYSDHKRAYICGGTHLYKTTDAAVSWQEIKYTGMPSNIDLSRIYIKTEDTLLLSASDGVNGMKIYLSPDKGQTWTMVAEKLYNGYIYGISGFYFDTQKHGYALAVGYYAETKDGGHTWIRNDIDVNTSFYGILEIKNHSTVISTNTQNPPVTSNAIYFKGGINKIVQAGTMLYGVYSGNFFSSVDSGKTWKIKSIDANKQFKSITFFNQQTGVIVGNELTTYTTKDGGTTWTKSVHGGAEGFNKMYCKTKDECYVLGNKSRLFHTIDGGTTWNYRELEKGMVNIVFPTIDTGYISAGSFIYRTIDAGKNWTIFKQTNASGGFIFFPTKDTGYVGIVTIDKTVDAGQTWNPAVDFNYVNNIDYGAGGACFRSTSEGLVSSPNNLLYTNDGGFTWQVKAPGIGATSIIPIKNNWLVINTQNVYVCDKDINCTLKYSNSNDYISSPIKRDSNTIIITAGNDSALISNDCGMTWKKEYFPYFGQLTLGNKSTIYSAVGANIYKGTFKAQTNSALFTQTDSKTLSCTISNDLNENYPASIRLITSTKDTILISTNTIIKNKLPISISLPSTILVGTNYSIEVLPNDTAAYSTVKSQIFTITGISNVDSENMPVIRVYKNRIDCDCVNYQLFNTLGQQIQHNTELTSGIYIIKCNNQIQKVLIP